MPVTLDRKGKVEQKQRSVCSLGKCNTQCTFWTGFLLQSFGNLCLVPICLLPSMHICPHLHLQGSSCSQDPLHQLPGREVRPWQGRECFPLAKLKGACLATWIVTMNQKDNPPPSACCLRHLHLTAKKCDHDACRQNQAGHGQSWKGTAVPRPPASFDSPQLSLCFCSIRFCSPPWVISSLGIVVRSSILHSSCSTRAKRLQTITEAQSSAINSCLACSEPTKWPQLILCGDTREQWGRLWQAGGNSCLCQGSLHFSPVRWLSYYISSLAWKLH